MCKNVACWSVIEEESKLLFVFSEQSIVVMEDTQQDSPVREVNQNSCLTSTLFLPPDLCDPQSDLVVDWLVSSRLRSSHPEPAVSGDRHQK